MKTAIDECCVDLVRGRKGAIVVFPREGAKDGPHLNHTRRFARTEEALTVLFCVLDDASYALLNPRARRYESLKRLSDSEVIVGGHRARALPTAPRRSERTLVLCATPRGGSFRTCFRA